jgi:hypothetical protein
MPHYIRFYLTLTLHYNYLVLKYIFSYNTELAKQIVSPLVQNLQLDTDIPPLEFSILMRRYEELIATPSNVPTQNLRSATSPPINQAYSLVSLPAISPPTNRQSPQPPYHPPIKLFFHSFHMICLSITPLTCYRHPHLLLTHLQC